MWNTIFVLYRQYFCILVKGYIRKAAALTAMKEWSRAQSAYESALMIDPNNAEARDGLRHVMVNNDEDPEKVCHCCAMIVIWRNFACGMRKPFQIAIIAFP